MSSGVACAYDIEGRRKYLSRTEGQKFLEKAVQLPLLEALFCLTIYYTGCRITEALNLDRQHVDSPMNSVLIRSLKKRNKKHIRRIPIPEFLVQALMGIAADEERQRFWSFSRTTGWRIIKKVMKNADISGLHATTKGLRHGFGVRGALGHVPINLIQNWMGHADVTTTIIYLSAQGEEERELIRRTWQ